MSSKFTKTKEDFTCEHCGFFVVGDGYTNHCPECLWSKHVDNNPGDRANPCGGLMKPVRIEEKNGRLIAVHSCTVCGVIKRNNLKENDNFKAAADIMAELANPKNF